MFTRIGTELAPICGSTKSEGFLILLFPSGVIWAMQFHARFLNVSGGLCATASTQFSRTPLYPALSSVCPPRAVLLGSADQQCYLHKHWPWASPFPAGEVADVAGAPRVRELGSGLSGRL